jgi:RNA polymerase sigma-70 factor, ECF subfamily
MDSVLAGDEEKALSLLGPDVVLISDAGPARRAARHPIVGAQRVRQQLIKVGSSLFGLKTRPSRDELPPVRILEVNSSSSLVLGSPEGPIVVTGEAVGEQITSIWVRLNPDKNAALEDPPPII